MSEPRFAACRCAHTRELHAVAGLTPQCSHTGCTCLQYRPDVARTSAATTSPIPRATHMTAVRSDSQRVVPIQNEAPRREPEISVRDQRAPSLEQILQAGKRSEYQRTVRLAEKIAVELNDLRGRLTDEREAVEAKRQATEAQERIKAEIAALEKDLATKRAALRGNPAPRTPGGSQQSAKQDCPTCGLPFSNLGVHRHKKHGWRKDSA